MLPLWHPNDDFCLYQHQYQLAVRVALLYMEEIHLTLWDALKDVVPFGVIAVSCMGAAYFLTRSIDNLYLILTAKIAIAAGLYIIIMQLSKSATFKEVINYLSKKK